MRVTTVPSRTLHSPEHHNNAKQGRVWTQNAENVLIPNCLDELTGIPESLCPDFKLASCPDVSLCPSLYLPLSKHCSSFLCSANSLPFQNHCRAPDLHKLIPPGLAFSRRSISTKRHDTKRLGKPRSQPPCREGRGTPRHFWGTVLGQSEISVAVQGGQANCQSCTQEEN